MSIREDIERPLTAYEELKAWCEKHLGNHYKGSEKHHLWNEEIVNYTGDEDCFQQALRIGDTLFVFADEGDLDCVDFMEGWERVMSVTENRG